jgi:UrcA family protein
MNTFITFTSTVVLSLIAANAAHAGDPGSAPKSRTVQFADLDLSKLEGAVTLLGRIRNAAQSVCSAHRGGTSLRDKQQYAACVEFAMSNAVATVDRPVLTQYVISHTSIKPEASIKVAADR